MRCWLLALLICLQRRGGSAAEDSAGTGDATGVMVQTCTFKGKSVHAQRCSGLRHCDAWNGQYGPQSDTYDCSRVEAEAVASVQGLFAGVDSTEVHTACWEALMTLHCARVFGQMQCEGAAELGVGTKPCSSACERISADCAEHTAGAQLGSGGLTCTAEMGYDTDPSICAPLPRQDQLVLAAQHGLSPLAVDFIQLWEADEERYDDTFLTSTHHTSRSEMKGWSFYTNGPRWFDPTWFGLEAGTAIQRQYSQLQAAEYVLRARIARRLKETGEEPDPVLLKQLVRTPFALLQLEQKLSPLCRAATARGGSPS